MKTTVKIPFKAGTKITVDVDDEVEKGKSFGTINYENNEAEINLSTILKVNPKDIYKFLKVKPGEGVSEGETLATKKSFITTLSVKSPFKGVIKEVDLKKGTVLLSSQTAVDSKKIVLPVSGKVKSIEKDYLDIEIKGIKFEGIQGGGGNVSGNLIHVSNSKNSIFDLDSDLEGKIVLLETGASDIMAKLDTIGASGMIGRKADKEFDFPFLTVEEDPFKTLFKYSGKLVWLRPSAREAIVLEE